MEFRMAFFSNKLWHARRCGVAAISALVLAAGMPPVLFAKGLAKENVGENLRLSDRLQIPAMWEYGPPLISPEIRDTEPSHAQKDPTFVFHDNRWHVFMTVKLPDRSAIEYCCFKKWEDAQVSKRTLLPISESDYFCAPQVFFFRPQNKWYLIYQMGVPDSRKMWVAYSTSDDISEPLNWTKAKPVLDGTETDGRTVGGLDYWVICDAENAYLFFTSLNGRMWRMSTRLSEFPSGFKDCEVALQADIFEASHTYKLKGLERYMTIIEQKGRRYMKAYIADSLAGEWHPVANTEQRPFAGFHNIRPRQGVTSWTDNISHGELVRDCNDERLLVDPDRLQFVFQGMLERDKYRKGYGKYDWRIGLLTPVPESRDPGVK